MCVCVCVCVCVCEVEKGLYPDWLIMCTALKYVTFYAKRDHVPEFVIFSSRPKILNDLCFVNSEIFVKNHPLPTFLCKMGAPHALNHPHEAFTFSHLLLSCIAYNSFNHAIPCHHGTCNENYCTRSVEKNTHSNSLQTKATYMDTFFSFRMALERGISTKDAVDKSCW